MAEEAKKKDRTRWFREMKSELKKIVWSDRKTVVKDTGTVLLCSLLIGVCIWVFDYVLVNGVQLFINFLS
jgi:preprotein translocase, SecE subunit, bacterial